MAEWGEVTGQQGRGDDMWTFAAERPVSSTRLQVAYSDCSRQSRVRRRPNGQTLEYGTARVVLNPATSAAVSQKELPELCRNPYSQRVTLKLLHHLARNPPAHLSGSSLHYVW